MRTSLLAVTFGVVIAAAAPPAARAQSVFCEDTFKLEAEDLECYRQGPDVPPIPPPRKPDPLQLRVLKYARVAIQHKLIGLASYYSTSLNGTLTANGEHYYNKRMSAAHLTLPLGSWVEIKAKATGKSIRLRVNDRGPYVKKFVIDLSQAAARALGVDVAEDRTVFIRIIGLPGEEPLPPGALDAPGPVLAEDELAAVSTTVR